MKTMDAIKMSASDVQYLKNQTREVLYPFKFERDFDELSWIEWTSKNWTYSFHAAVVYIVVIFSLKYYMRNRPRYELRTPLAIWSGALAIFSICSTCRLTVEAFQTLFQHGWVYSVCYPTLYFGDTAVWAFLFAVSKPVELGDTIFIILRKQQLIFLHWYHHVTVMVFCAYMYAYYYASGRWFAAVNGVVHSVMYTYYFLKALKFRIPRSVNVVITTMQLVQMIFGIIVLMSAKYVVESGRQCHVSHDNIQYGLLMYASYFALFGNFFYKTYMSPKQSPRTTSPKKSN